jgi:hypothetical protein
MRHELLARSAGASDQHVCAAARGKSGLRPERPRRRALAHDAVVIGAAEGVLRRRAFQTSGSLDTEEAEEPLELEDVAGVNRELFELGPVDAQGRSPLATDR